jgi:hypothetical protein
VLGRYRQAYSALDVIGVSQVWPDVDDRALGRAFNQLESQTIEFGVCEIDMRAGEARASCDGRASYVPRVGARRTQVEARQWQFVLNKFENRWLIREVQAKAR